MLVLAGMAVRRELAHESEYIRVGEFVQAIPLGCRAATARLAGPDDRRFQLVARGVISPGHLLLAARGRPAWPRQPC